MYLLGLDRYQETALRNRIESTIDLQKLYQSIDQVPDLIGAGVRFIDSEFNIIELRPFDICRRDPVYIILREPPKKFNPQEFASYLKQNQNNSRENQLVKEVSGAVLSCGAAILGWIVVIGSFTAIPVSGGSSAAVTYLSTGAAVASSAQCGISLYRSKNEIFDRGEINDDLNSEQWYKMVSHALDIISVGGALAASAAVIKSLKLLKNSSNSYAELLKGLSRPKRRRLTEEIIRVNNPRVPNRLLKQIIKSGRYPKRYSSSALQSAYALQVKDAVGAAMSFGGSILSGNINFLAVGIWELTNDEG